MILKKFNSGKSGFVTLTAMILCFLISLSLSSCHKESPQSEPQEVTDNGKESELEKATRQDYPSLFLTELSFDGSTYTTCPLNRVEGDYVHAERKGIDSSKKSWKYLKRLTDVPRVESALYKSAERYVLVNDDSITWDDLISGMISSQMGDYIPFEEVITIYDEE